MQNNQAKGMSGGKQGDALDLGDEYEDDEEGDDDEVEEGVDQALHQQQQQQQEGQQDHQIYTHNQQPPGMGSAAIHAYN